MKEIAPVSLVLPVKNQAGNWPLAASVLNWCVVMLVREAGAEALLTSTIGVAPKRTSSSVGVRNSVDCWNTDEKAMSDWRFTTLVSPGFVDARNATLRFWVRSWTPATAPL